jgi:hypothetical protein
MTSPYAFPAKVAVQDDEAHPELRGWPAAFHVVGCKHLTTGKRYTQEVTLKRALAKGFRPCQKCFPQAVADPSGKLAKAAKTLKGSTSRDLYDQLPPADEAAPLEPRVSVQHKRNAAVVVLTLRRADGECEMPGCKAELFHTEGNGAYLEVHHLHLLADGGPDHPSNTAALCPSCHRRLHHGADRSERLNVLRKAIAKREAAFSKQILGQS